MFYVRDRRQKLFFVIGWWLITCTIIVFWCINKNITGSSFQCKNSKKCTNFLLVADPQITGERNEVFPVSILSIWHNDVYLERNYNRAYNFVKPNIVVFLGDLMDEGSSATEDEFWRYFHRFRKIFPQDTSTQYIYLPGDNDIGGEGNEKASEAVLKRFNISFNVSSYITHYKNITFYQINGMTRKFPNNPNHYLINENRTQNKITTIGLSHYTLPQLDSSFRKQIIGTTQSRLFFTGHEHKAKIIIRNRTSNAVVDHQNIINDNIFNYSLDGDSYYEFQLPPSSYRMGTRRIGYGHGVLEEDRLYFRILWTPSGFWDIPVAFFVIISVFTTVKKLHDVPEKTRYFLGTFLSLIILYFFCKV